MEARRKPDSAAGTTTSFSTSNYSLAARPPAVDRPRPATSAGEYHHGTYHTSQITSAPTLITAQIAMPPSNPSPFQYDTTIHPQTSTPGWNAGYQATAPTIYTPPLPTSSPYSHRPVTAPVYYSQVPTFGFTHLSNGHNIQTPPPQPLLSPGSAGGHTPTSQQQLQQQHMHQQQLQQQQMLQHQQQQQQHQQMPTPNFARRMSLPAHSMSFAYNSSGAGSGFGSIQEEGSNSR